MRRRRALAVVVGALTTGFAGCSSGSGNGRTEPPDERTVATELRATLSTPTPTPPAPPPASAPSPTVPPSRSHREAFAGFLADEGITATSLRVDAAARTVTLRYVSGKTGYEEIGAQIGTISGGFFRQVARGWEMDRLDATMLDPGETPVATWYAETAWFREFRRGEIPAEELSLRILETLEPVEGSSS